MSNQLHQRWHLVPYFWVGYESRKVEKSMGPWSRWLLWTKVVCTHWYGLSFHNHIYPILEKLGHLTAVPGSHEPLHCVSCACWIVCLLGFLRGSVKAYGMEAEWGRFWWASQTQNHCYWSSTVSIVLWKRS